MDTKSWTHEQSFVYSHFQFHVHSDKTKVTCGTGVSRFDDIRVFPAIGESDTTSETNAPSGWGIQRPNKDKRITL